MSASHALFERACRVSPGGVHSPVRSFAQVGGTPRFVASARGAFLRDVEGRDYLDFCMGFGPLILGHDDPDVREAAASALARGTCYGAAEPYSLALAELIVSRVPWVESVRFVNSGTEAVMSALRVARAATGRAKVLKFDGCYHGHADPFLIRAGSGLAASAEADSAGLAPSALKETVVAPLDDFAALEELFARQGDTLAAAIIEPLPANRGLLPQRDAFLAGLARLCRTHGTILIFDEVISGFRVAFGGHAERAGIRPDLVTYGKIIGGGFPVGAYGGRRDLMDLVAPAGPVYQAGTLSANPVAMCAGLAALAKLDASAYARLEILGRRLESAFLDRDDVLCQRVGSLFWLCFDAKARYTAPLRSVRAIPSDAAPAFAPVFHALLERGIYLPPSAFEVGFLSLAHTDADIDRLADAVGAAMTRARS